LRSRLCLRIGVHPNHFVATRFTILEPAEKALHHGEIEDNFRIVRRSIEGACERALGFVVKVQARQKDTGVGQ
jgi:hypothetical protein